MQGYIKLHRQLLEWEWYSDNVVKDLFIHLLLNANHKTCKWRGVTIGKGQVLTGRLKLATELNFTEMQIRTALKKLKSTNEITIKTTKQYSIITINKWNLYQQDNQQNNQQITNKQPTNNQQVTTNNNDKNVKNDNNVFFIGEKTKKTDPYIENSVIEKFKSEHKRVFGNKIYLDAQQRQRIMELNADIEDFTDTIPETFEKLKNTDFDLPNFNPNGAWLLRDNNYTNVLNGLYDGKQKKDIWEELREKERLRNGKT